MGEIIHGYDPALIIPARYRFSQIGFLRPLKEFVKRNEGGLDLNPVAVKMTPGGRYAGVEGFKNAIIAFAEGRKINLFVMNDKFDAIPYGFFPDVDHRYIDRLNDESPVSFVRVEENIWRARRKGVKSMEDVVRANIGQLNLAWVEVLKREISIKH